VREIVRQAEWYGIEELRERGKEKGDFEPDFHRKEIESLLKPPGIVQGTMARHAEEGLFSIMDDPRKWTRADPTVSMMFEDDLAPGH
jgi:hypothetical protein